MYLVIGASGRVGREVVAQLRASGEAVRAISRERARGDSDGVEWVAGDLGLPASLAAAAHGATAVFLIWPALDAALAPGAVAALAGEVGKIVYLSTAAIRDDLATQDHPLSAMHAIVENAVRQDAANWTILRATKFAANTLGWAAAIRDHGAVEAAYGNMRRSPIDERDIAAAAVAALRDGVATRETLTISGPESLTEDAQLALIAAAIGRPLIWRGIDPDEARRRLIKQGSSEELADAALAYWARLVEHPEPVTDVVPRLTGQAARPFAQWAIERAELFLGETRRI